MERALQEKSKDEQIFKRLITLKEFEECKTVLTYVSTIDEISTSEFINFSLSKGKRVAVPRCRDKKGNMDFFYINSLNDLSQGTFGISEPDENAERAVDLSASLAIIPAIAFDRNGNRIGYGGGYYDRFLENFSFISVGLCYNSLVKNLLPIEKHDVSVDIIVTEKEIIYCKNGGKNG